MKFANLIKERLLGKVFKTTDLYGDTYAVFDSLEVSFTYDEKNAAYLAKAVAKNKDGTIYRIPVEFPPNSYPPHSNITINFDSMKILVKISYE